jgi:predicted glutamine amidotransferase
MCRVLFAVGEGERMRPLLEALVKASENDPYKAARGKGNQHRDGWGYVVFQDGSLTHYRSEKPVFEDMEAVKKLSGSLHGFTVLLAHSRAASQGTKSLFNVQPFAFSSRRGFSFWLYHNGDLDKEKIIELAEFDKKDFEKASDSYAFGAYLCRKLESPSEGHLLEHYSKIARTTKTSFNTGAFFLSPDSAVGFVTAYAEPTYLLRRQNWDYVRQIVLNEKDLFAVASSTLELYHEAKWENAVNGTAFYVEIDGKNERFNVKKLILG